MHAGGFPNQRRSVSWAVGLGGLTGCGAMHCETTNGIGSKTFFRAAKAMSAARPRTIDCSLKLFSIAIAPAFAGAICRSGSVTGKSFTTLQPVGEEWSFCTHPQYVGQRSRQRIHDDRRQLQYCT